MPKAIHNYKHTPLLACISAQRKQEYRAVRYLLPQDDLSDNRLMASWRRFCSAGNPAKKWLEQMQKQLLDGCPSWLKVRFLMTQAD